MNERELPYNLDAEQAVLGSILIDPVAYELIADQLAALDFYRDAHRTIYETVVALARTHTLADSITLCDELERHNQLDAIGGPGYISLLINTVPTSGNVRYYADIVVRAAQHRRLIHAAGTIAAVGYNQDDDALEQAEKALSAVSLRSANQRDFSTAGEVVDQCLMDLFALQNGTKSLIGVPTGFQGVDHYLGGMQRSDLIILAARPGMGKSSYMLSLIYYIVFTAGLRAALFSLEMSKLQLVQRLLSFDSGIPLYCIRNGYIQDHEYERLLASQSRLHTNLLNIDDTGGITLASLRSKARKLKAQQGLDFLAVDYLQLMHGDGGNRNQNREQEVAEISKGLKELAKELDIPILALAQLSRACESRADKRPMLSDLRESGSIENDADVILFLFREGYYDSSVPQSKTENIIAKHRNGPTGTVDLFFRKEETRFEEVPA